MNNVAMSVRFIVSVNFWPLFSMEITVKTSNHEHILDQRVKINMGATATKFRELFAVGGGVAFFWCACYRKRTILFFLKTLITSTNLVEFWTQHLVGSYIIDGCPPAKGDSCLNLEQRGCNMGACLPAANHTGTVGCLDIPFFVDDHQCVLWLLDEPVRMKHLQTYIKINKYINIECINQQNMKCFI